MDLNQDNYFNYFPLTFQQRNFLLLKFLLVNL